MTYAAFGSCPSPPALPASLSPEQAAAAMLDRIVQSWQLPYWGMPVPRPEDMQVLAAAMDGAWLKPSAQGACSIVLARDSVARVPIQRDLATYCAQYDPTGACDQMAATIKAYTYPFASWLTSGVTVIAERRLGPLGVWDIAQSQFLQVPIDRTLPLLATLGPLVGAVPIPIEAKNAAVEFVSVMLMLERGRQGLLSDVTDWIVVYAPRLANMGLATSGGQS